MDIFVYDKNFRLLTIIDTFESFIWAERFSENGDFELFTSMDLHLLEYIKQDNYVGIKDSNVLMIIEKINIQTNDETGDELIITGRSVSSILERRIIWTQRMFDGSLEDSILNMINENIDGGNREIEFIVALHSGDEHIKSLKLKAQYTGDNLYDAIKKVCDDNNIGFKVYYANGYLRFKLLAGTDRTYNQSKYPYVIFSPRFDNIISGDYLETKSNLKTTALVLGEGEGLERKRAVVGDEISGLERRELYVDARDISQGKDEEKISDEAYIELLKQRGREKLVEHSSIMSFEGQAEANTMFKYGKDFFLGDIVQVEDNYGHHTTARITEIIISVDSKGMYIRPTFKMKDAKK